MSVGETFIILFCFLLTLKCVSQPSHPKITYGYYICLSLVFMDLHKNSAVPENLQIAGQQSGF